eukprot:CAMPEP_0179976370 /NCGR_PEP_ID=MMETSP0983-20121128/39343_1 /TAXON_ID=483367 /ORGANISM="non described non described, Strain CCMP 2436" /LENGTH=36 /DNA_ID= /DNA_START= /DNA_END= /DNA_ORIENTATION=
MNCEFHAIWLNASVIMSAGNPSASTGHSTALQVYCE